MERLCLDDCLTSPAGRLGGAGRRCYPASRPGARVDGEEAALPPEENLIACARPREGQVVQASKTENGLVGLRNAVRALGLPPMLGMRTIWQMLQHCAMKAIERPSVDHVAPRTSPTVSH